MGEVPKEFIKKMIAGKEENDENIRTIQVEYPRAFIKTCSCLQIHSIGVP